LYFYYVQHTKGKNTISPFPPRGNPKAAVATPLHLYTFFKAKEVQNFDPILQFLKNK
jgi:bifunctional non-homologous end joining protein LigD